MIGYKKLSTIREELRCALEATGEDPIRWLEQRMTAPSGKIAESDGSEVLRSLQRFLEGPSKKKRSKARVRSKNRG